MVSASLVFRSLRKMIHCIVHHWIFNDCNSSRWDRFENDSLLLCTGQMTYVTEIRLTGGRGAWSRVAPSSCPEVDLEVIEEFLQEHSLEVQPAHTPASPPTAVWQQMHSHHGTRIIGQWKDNGMVQVPVYFYLVYLTVCFYAENSWSGQHPYEWHCGSHTPNGEYKEQALPSTWPSPQDNQWVSTGPRPLTKLKLYYLFFRSHLRHTSLCVY